MNSTLRHLCDHPTTTKLIIIVSNVYTSWEGNED